MKTKFYSAIFVACSTVVLLYGLFSIQQRKRFDRFYKAYPHNEQMRESIKLNHEVENNTIAREYEFAKIWNRRGVQDITTKLNPFLNDPSLRLREQAVRGLGRIEAPSALPKLIDLKKRITALNSHRNATRDEWDKVKAVNSITLDLAIARIESRKLRGEIKLNYLIKAVGLQWKDFAVITQRAYYIADGTSPPPRVPISYAEKTLVNEVIDVMYQMKSNKQDINPLIKPLALAPAERVWLSTAGMSSKESIPILLNYISTLKVVREQDDILTNSIFLSLGGDILPEMRRYLDKLTTHPNPTSQREGTVQLIRAVAYIGDLTSLDVLRKLSKDKDQYISSEAKQSISDIKSRNLFVYAPA